MNAETPDETTDRKTEQLVQQLIDQIVKLGLEGKGPIKGAERVAREHAEKATDIEQAIARLIRTHTRNVAATGFASGFGGIVVAGVMIPADITALYVQAARLAGAIAVLRGYDIKSEEVRSVVLLTLIGSAGASIVSRTGVELGTKAAFATLRRLPGRILIEINKAVGFRLVTKFGTKGVINLGKLVPIVGGGLSAGINVATMRMVGGYARRNFPVLEDGPDPDETSGEPEIVLVPSM